MRDFQMPKHLIVGIGEGDDTYWQIQRASDLAICGADVGHYPRVREWTRYEDARTYLKAIEDGPRLKGLDAPVIWMTFDMPALQPPAPHVDGVL